MERRLLQARLTPGARRGPGWLEVHRSSVPLDEHTGVHVDTKAGPWYVRRRWAPRHLGADTIWGRFRNRNRRVRRRTSDLADVPDPGCSPDVGEAIVVFLIAIAVIVFMVFVGLPFLVALGELLLVLVLAVGGAIGRLLFRRPWTVDAVGPDGEHHQWSVVGWRTSGAARRFIADRIAATGTVPTSDELSAAVLAS